jgi:hypothetical protein
MEEAEQAFLVTSDTSSSPERSCDLSLAGCLPATGPQQYTEKYQFKEKQQK